MKYIYGLLGEKLSHSLSDKIHNKIFSMLNIDANYNYFEVEPNNLNNAFSGFKAVNVSGINVTIPYKLSVMKYLDFISKEAEKIGAVNTIAFKDEMLCGYNTDYFGFSSMLDKNNINPKSKNVYILGSGGASKAVSLSFYDKNAEFIYIVSRNKEKAETSYKDNIKNFNNKLKFITYDEFYEKDPHGILVNCTPIGMYPNINACPVKKDIIKNFEAAVDIIYNPKETLFLRCAREYNIKAVNGMYMLAAQAAKSEEIWNGAHLTLKNIEDIVKLLEESI